MFSNIVQSKLVHWGSCYYSNGFDRSDIDENFFLQNEYHQQMTLYSLIIDFNLKLVRKIFVPSKNRVLQLQTAISPELFKSDKRFIQRSKEEHRGFQINF